MSGVTRARCCECLVEHQLKQDGTLRWHMGDLYIGGWRQVCDGVGKPPAVMFDPLSGINWASDAGEEKADG